MGHQSGREYMLGHSSPMMVRRYSATYDSEQAAKAHGAFSPCDAAVGLTEPPSRDHCLCL